MEELHRNAKQDLAKSPRQEVHDRVHGFLMGFGALRGMDPGTATLAIADYVEAIEDMLIIQAVHRACKAWNGRKFTWANYRYPPDPPEFARAVSEIKADMEVETYDIGLILLAAPLPNPDKGTISEEERDRVIAAALAKGSIGGVRPVNEVLMEEAQAEYQARILRDLDTTTTAWRAEAPPAGAIDQPGATP